MMSSDVTTRPFRPFVSLGRPFEHLWHDFQRIASDTFPAVRGGAESCFSPPVDIAETDRVIEVRMDIPGMTGKDIDVQVHQNVLTISGQRKEEKEEKGKKFHRIERLIGRFSNSINLPTPVKEAEVAAEYRNGVLLVTLPKTVDSRSRTIEVKA
jgi:HSP20 family protein